MIRSLHICSGNLYGGVETVQVALARYSAQLPGTEIGFAACFEGRLTRELQKCGVRVHNLGAVRIRNPLSVWSARSRLRTLLSEIRYDAAICHSDWTQAIFGPVVKKKRIPLLYWLHGVPSKHHWLHRWASQTHPDEVICCSEFTATRLSNLYPGVPKEVVYAPVPSIERLDSETRLEIRREFATPADAVVVIQVSRLETLKGHRLHLEALAKLQDLSGWVCWIVGGAQRKHELRYLDDLRREADRRGISDRVRFLGQRSDVRRLLPAADVFCQPNTGPEGFGIVFVEALLAGLPVITTSMGGGLEIINSSCGVLSEPNNAVILADALRKVISQSATRSQMAKAAIERGRQLCDPFRQLTRLSDVIGNTLSRLSAV